MPDFQEGDFASFAKTITEADILLFAAVTGDFNPLHINAQYAAETPYRERVAHGMLTAGLISTVIGTKLPGPGAVYLSQTLSFVAPVRLGDTITAMGTLRTYDRKRGRMTIETVCRNQHGENVLTGEAQVRYRP